jgi:glycosyltransferase involved in cell wall biosynthesis
MGKLKGAVSVMSNSPYLPTGYGIQAGYLVDRLKRDGVDVAALSNYGLDGTNNVLKTPYGEIPHYARGFDPYSNDVIPMNHAHHTANANKASKTNLNDVLVTLYDVWVLKGKAYDNINQIASWTPLDHITIPPEVLKWLQKSNVLPIAMSPHGKRQMEENGLECEYIPHAVDTKVMKPTATVNGVNTRKFMGVQEDDFIVGMNAANKASGMLHRKAFAENIMAFSIFAKNRPDAKLYLHTDPFGGAGGWNLLMLCESLGLRQEQVIFPDIADYRYGISQEILAGFYTTMDVMLTPSFGEGFGVPTIEAQSCGTPIIGSNWAATPDLVSEDCYLVDGQPAWDAGQNAWWQIPSIPAITNALEAAYAKKGQKSQKSIDFVKQFDVDTVWSNQWLPLWKKLLG